MQVKTKVILLMLHYIKNTDFDGIGELHGPHSQDVLHVSWENKETLIQSHLKIQPIYSNIDPQEEGKKKKSCGQLSPISP